MRSRAKNSCTWGFGGINRRVLLGTSFWEGWACLNGFRRWFVFNSHSKVKKSNCTLSLQSIRLTQWVITINWNRTGIEILLPGIETGIELESKLESKLLPGIKLESNWNRNCYLESNWNRIGIELESKLLSGIETGIELESNWNRICYLESSLFPAGIELESKWVLPGNKTGIELESKFVYLESVHLRAPGATNPCRWPATAACRRSRCTR